MVLFPPSFYFVFDISNFYIQNISSNEGGGGGGSNFFLSVVLEEKKIITNSYFIFFFMFICQNVGNLKGFLLVYYMDYT